LRSLAKIQSGSIKNILISSWWAGVHSVQGRRLVAANKSLKHKNISSVLAIGKAASSMYLGAVDLLGAEIKSGLLITKYHHVDDAIKGMSNVEVIESAHPVPDKNSLIAGEKAIDFVQKVPQTEALLLLVSGGASALAESLKSGFKLEELAQITEKLLANGCSIDAINATRTLLSKIKGGGLTGYFSGKAIFVNLISDVEGNDVSVIGSGIGSHQPATQIIDKIPYDLVPQLQQLQRVTAKSVQYASSPCHATIIGSNEVARLSIEKWYKKRGFKVNYNEETLYGELNDISRKIAATLLAGKPGVYIWGGEPTVNLPANPGTGGRNQSLALSLAIRLGGHDNIHIIAAGTDGTDGPTLAAGGLVNGSTINEQHIDKAKNYLEAANAGTFLRECNSLFVSGATGTNVMDLVIAIKE